MIKVRRYVAVNDNADAQPKADLQSMKEAVARMMASQAEFQNNLAKLDQSMAEIEANMMAYNKNLGDISGKLAHSTELSRRLEEIMDDYLETSS